MAKKRSVASLSVSLTARTSAFERALKRAQKQTAKFRDAIGAMARKAGKFGAVLGGAAVAGMVVLTKRAFDTIDAISKLSDRIGISTEAIAGLQHAAEITGAGSEAMNKGLEMMARRLGEAAMGTGEAKAALATLGLDVGKLLQMSPAAAFGAIAEAMQKLGSQSEKAAIAALIFGRAGVKLVNTLDLGKEGLAAMAEEAERLGITFDRATGAKIENANDALTRMKQTFVGLGRQIAANVAPALEVLAAKLSAGKETIGKIAVGAGKLADMLVRIGGAGFDSALTMGKWTVALGGSIAVMAGVARGIAAIVAAVKAARAAQVSLLALMGPPGWATIAAGVAIGITAVATLDAKMKEYGLEAELAAVNTGTLAEHFPDLAAGARNAAAGVEQVSKAASAADSAFDRLTRQIISLRYGEEQAFKLDLARSGVSRKRIDFLVNLHRHLARVRKEQQDANRATQDWQSVIERFRQNAVTPFEQIEETVANLHKALAKGDINESVFGRNMRQLQEDLQRMKGDGKTSGARGGVSQSFGALQKGSAAEFAARHKAESIDATIKQTSATRQRQLAQINALLDRIAAELADNAPPVTGMG